MMISPMPWGEVMTAGAPKSQPIPPQTTASQTMAPALQMLCNQVPPLSIPWAGAAQSEEDKQKLVQLLQAAAPAYYAD